MSLSSNNVAPSGLVLTVNGGSSSVKFALYRRATVPKCEFRGTLDGIGRSETTICCEQANANRREAVGSLNALAAADFLCDFIAQRLGRAQLDAIGHRIVDPGSGDDTPRRVTPALLGDLRRAQALASQHLPAEIAMIEAFARRMPETLQFACFDTTFHRDMPRVAKLLAVPRRFQALGLERRGFHGLSYAYLLEELVRTAGADLAHGKVILAHLGNGASLAAVYGGKSVDTSMGFTPSGGLPMGTRAGDIDPGLLRYFTQVQAMDVHSIDRMLNNESGLLGISGRSSDMGELLRLAADDTPAAEAVAFFCYQVRKWIGAFAAALGGLEVLVFSGGIGENAPAVRAGACEGLGFLGLELDETRNAAGAPVISADGSKVQVRVIHTDEELMIATTIYALLSPA